MVHKSYYFITKYFLMFILSSFIGWAYEIICEFILYGYYFDRGVLHLPACPIYGFGMLMLYPVFRKVKNPLAVFAGSALITTAIELASSLILEYRFHMILWSYEGWPFNYQNRISLVSSCIFGIMALLFIRLIAPLIQKLYEKDRAKYTAAFSAALFSFCLIWELHFR